MPRSPGSQGHWRDLHPFGSLPGDGESPDWNNTHQPGVSSDPNAPLTPEQEAQRRARKARSDARARQAMAALQQHTPPGGPIEKVPDLILLNPTILQTSQSSNKGTGVQMSQRLLKKVAALAPTVKHNGTAEGLVDALIEAEPKFFFYPREEMLLPAARAALGGSAAGARFSMGDMGGGMTEQRRKEVAEQMALNGNLAHVRPAEIISSGQVDPLRTAEGVRLSLTDSGPMTAERARQVADELCYSGGIPGSDGKPVAPPAQADIGLSLHPPLSEARRSELVKMLCSTSAFAGADKASSR